jgi:hypothetical protein
MSPHIHEVNNRLRLRMSASKDLGGILLSAIIGIWRDVVEGQMSVTKQQYSRRDGLRVDLGAMEI